MTIQGVRVTWSDVGFWAVCVVVTPAWWLYWKVRP